MYSQCTIYCVPQSTWGWTQMLMPQAEQVSFSDNRKGSKPEHGQRAPTGHSQVQSLMNRP